MTEVAFAVLLLVPAGQRVHADADDSANCPATHPWQDSSPTEAAKKPAAQCTQLPASTREGKEPFEQFKQVDQPDDANIPGAHLTHDAALLLGEYLPFTQGKQADTLPAPAPGLALPAWQEMHAVAPARA
jgi:hypothetical protein